MKIHSNPPIQYYGFKVYNANFLSIILKVNYDHFKAWLGVDLPLMQRTMDSDDWINIKDIV